MPKYYVDAGELRKIIDSPDPETAAVTVFKTLNVNPVSSLNNVTIVSEEGFDSCSGEDWCFPTIDILEKSDQIGFYTQED